MAKQTLEQMVSFRRQGSPWPDTLGSRRVAVPVRFDTPGIPGILSAICHARCFNTNMSRLAIHEFGSSASQILGQS